MKTYLECIPCFMQQALRAGRMTAKNEEQVKLILDEVSELVPNFSLENTPAEYGAEVYRIIKEITGVVDPYKQIKEDSINEALALIPDLKQIIDESDNRLLTAVRIAIAGNVIDFGVNESFSLIEDIGKILVQDFAVSDFNYFKSAVKKAEKILYIGDNAGESVFDKLLIEEMGKPVIYAVREIPVINDSTYEDAVNSGLADVATIISSGVKAPGTILNQCNNEFLELFKSADMVISKGQGNYEGLSDVNRPLFFLLKAKCEVIAKDLGMKKNDIILKGINLI
ncbi:MAG: ARMT1-like domain-containing protein [Bacteroidales bacterium]|nr:ARMT1-like domain-containing protein [Bacteroidales bacterium]